MKNMASVDFHDSVRRALQEVDRRLATGELDGSGRFYSDEQLANGAASGRPAEPKQATKAPAA